MTVSTAPTPLSYSGNGSTTSFPVSWKYNAKSHVVATLRSSAGVETVWVLTTNYTLTDPGDTGTLTALVAPATGATLVITLEPPNTQSSDIPLGGDFPSVTVEDGLDLAAQRDAKIEALFLRALRVPKTDTQTGSLLEIPIDSLRANTFLGFDANGKPIAAAGTSANLGPVSTFVNTILDDPTSEVARATLGAQILDPGACGGRLTLTTAVAVTTADVAAAATIYFTPYKGGSISLYGGTLWAGYSFAELSLAVPAVATQMYDVFAYNNAGVVAIEALAWTNDTTRATALVLQNGVLVKSGDTIRKYLGSFRTVASGQTEDSISRRFVWNYYNRVSRHMRVLEATDSWAYDTAVFRQANGAVANQLDFIVGVSEDVISAQVTVSLTSNTGGTVAIAGVGLDSTTALAAGCLPGRAVTDSNVGSSITAAHASWTGYPAVGRHFLTWLERGSGGGAVLTWRGDDGAPTSLQSGISGTVWA